MSKSHQPANWRANQYKENLSQRLNKQNHWELEFQREAEQSPKQVTKPGREDNLQMDTDKTPREHRGCEVRYYYLSSCSPFNSLVFVSIRLASNSSYPPDSEYLVHAPPLPASIFLKQSESVFLKHQDLNHGRSF